MNVKELTTEVTAQYMNKNLYSQCGLRCTSLDKDSKLAGPHHHTTSKVAPPGGTAWTGLTTVQCRHIVTPSIHKIEHHFSHAVQEQHQKPVTINFLQ